jgi:hypothetical protein
MELDHQKAFDGYSALPQGANAESFEQEWSQVESTRNKFLGSAIASVVLLAGFGITFAF